MRSITEVNYFDYDHKVGVDSAQVSSLHPGLDTEMSPEVCQLASAV